MHEERSGSVVECWTWDWRPFCGITFFIFKCKTFLMPFFFFQPKQNRIWEKSERTSHAVQGLIHLVVQQRDLSLPFSYKERILNTILNWRSDYALKTHTQIEYIMGYLWYDVANGNEITPCNKIDKPLVVYRFSGKVRTSVTTLRT